MRTDTTQRDDAIARMFREKYSYDDIARQLGLTRNQVAGVCHRRGLKRQKTERLTQWTKEQAALKAKREREAAEAAAAQAKADAEAEAERAERAIDMRDLDILCDVKEGHSRRDIAKHWGVSESFVTRLVEAARAA